MNIKQCETFLRLVEEGSISKAAQKMFFLSRDLAVLFKVLKTN